MAGFRTITHQVIKDTFDFDEATGAIKWKPRPCDQFSSVRAANSWNSRYAGKRCACLDSHGYIQIKLRPFILRGHQVAWNWMTGEWPIVDVDHINGDRFDNRWTNLRLATRSENNRNRHVARKTKLPIGVTRHRCGKYRAYLTIGGRQISFGYFDELAMAVASYNEKAPCYLGEFFKESVING